MITKIGLLAVAILLVTFSGCQSLEPQYGSLAYSGTRGIYVSRVLHVGYKTYQINAEIKPGSLAVADKYYWAVLYEKGVKRQNAVIGWTQPELNVSTVKTAVFSCTENEYSAYDGKDISSVFSVVVVYPPIEIK